MGAHWRHQHENIVFASAGVALPMRNKGVGTVLYAEVVPSSRRRHPTEKPSDLLFQILEATPNGTVIDPFMGSGTTLIAAQRSGRCAIGIEIEERYCEITARRLEQQVLFVPEPEREPAGSQVDLFGGAAS
jgi:DNA modification methylase